jgi:hypothetical protein
VNRIFKFLTASFMAFRTAPPAARVGSLLFVVASVADGTLTPFFPLWARNDASIPVECIGLLLGCYAGQFAGNLSGRVLDRV